MQLVLGSCQYLGKGLPAPSPKGIFQDLRGPRTKGAANTKKRERFCTWTPKVCKMMAFMAVIISLRLFFYIILGFR